MNNAFRFLTSLIAASCFLSAVQGAGQTGEQLGVLEAYLREAGHPLISRRILGTLRGRNGTKATFTAIIASDPSSLSVRARGVQVRLEDGQQKHTVYLDEEIVCRDERRGVLPDDSLKLFLSDLSRLVEDRDSNLLWVEPFTRTVGATAVRAATVGALNSPVDASRPAQKLRTPAFTVLDLGWYEKKDEKGVIIQCLRRGHDFYFADADLAKVRDMIASARDVLGVSDDGSKPCPPVLPLE